MQGKVKSEWAEEIAPHMDVNRNESPSFRDFHDTLQQLLTAPEHRQVL